MEGLGILIEFNGFAFTSTAVREQSRNELVHSGTLNIGPDPAISAIQ